VSSVFKDVVVVVPRKEAKRDESASDVCGLVEKSIVETRRLTLVDTRI
jgi:hypothetical protein